MSYGDARDLPEVVLGLKPEKQSEDLYLLVCQSPMRLSLTKGLWGSKTKYQISGDGKSATFTHYPPRANRWSGASYQSIFFRKRGTCSTPFRRTRMSASRYRLRRRLKDDLEHIVRGDKPCALPIPRCGHRRGLKGTRALDVVRGRHYLVCELLQRSSLFAPS